MAAVHGMRIGRLPWGAEHHRAYRKLFCHRTGMVAICEDLPEEHNTVTLDPVLKDADGIPAPKITYTLSQNSRRMLDHAVARAIEILRAAGAYDVWHEASIPEGGWHLMGTARMGTDPGRSVVNEWGRSHDVVHRRWQHLRDVGRRESDAHDPGAGALRSRQHQAAPGHAV
jgi:choline dehydrogenase-like flavoprotein